MMDINYVPGDATRPALTPHSANIIAHLCNDAGAWGAGFVLALSRATKEPERAYRLWARNQVTTSIIESVSGAQLVVPSEFGLGGIQLVKITGHDEPATLYVANLIAQHGIRRHSQSAPPIRYDALLTALESLSNAAKFLAASIHMPRIGAGLAGGKWNLIEPIISSTLTSDGINVTVYNLPTKNR